MYRIMYNAGIFEVKSTTLLVGALLVLWVSPGLVLSSGIIEVVDPPPPVVELVCEVVPEEVLVEVVLVPLVVVVVVVSVEVSVVLVEGTIYVVPLIVIVV